MPNTLSTATCVDLIPTSGSKLFIGAALPATYDAAGYDAVAWTEIGMWESVGDVGAENEVGVFIPLGSNTPCQFMGKAKPITMEIKGARVTSDAGQTALLAHSGQIYSLPYKIESTQFGTTTQGHTKPAKPLRWMFTALCPKAMTSVGTGSEAVKLNATLAINGTIIEAPKANSAA